ncbi:membrane-associated protein [Amycolatopsis sulphurea]|uniref:Membrane-associated protein n=1 Tax=Amycolatopsis sulphurea TaxID=76022 RepID=A0A2A9FFU2_9PSEU|nr:DedA family protein [Amycolatopsis sulphurea]PFG49360.1 membrane-associated protein [Amycolatopsis sulphurea]
MGGLLDPQSLLATFGPIGVFVVLFAETGLLIGFFLPGDSLLFTAGVLAASGKVHLSLLAVIACAAAGALLGAQTGFVLGKRGGSALLARVRNRHLHQGVTRGSAMLTRYGLGKAVVLARFIPVVRTVLNPLAGVAGMPAARFALWQVLGGLLWTAGVPLAGYALGSSVPNIDTYLLPIIAVVVLVSLSPLVLEIVRARGSRVR